MTSNQVLDGFTSSEVMTLTGINHNFLRYLHDRDVVVPLKIPMETGKRNRRLYTFSQLLEIKAIKILRNSVPVRTIKAVQEFISANCQDTKLSNKDLVALDINGKTEVFWVNDFNLTQLSGKYQGQIAHMELFLIPSFDTHVKEIEAVVNSGNCETVDITMFREKVKGSRHLSLVA